MNQGKKPDPKDLPPSKEPPVKDPDQMDEAEKELYKHSEKNEPAPGGQEEVRPEEQSGG